MATETFTRAELITRILQKLRVLGIGQPAQPEQEAVADGIIDPGLAELYRTTDIQIEPDYPMDIWWKENLAEYLSYFCAEDFARSADPARKVYAETRLRAIASNGPTFEKNSAPATARRHHFL